jgi:hypothetical protein
MTQFYRKIPTLHFTDEPFLQAVNEQVLNVWKMKQYEQRTVGWYQARNERITASAVASTLMQSEDSCQSYIEYYKLQDSKKIDPRKTCNEKETQFDFILGKCGYGTAFQGNEFTRWGQKYENVVTNIYSQLHQVDILEFGLIPHPSIDFLAASPDGISTQGIMLEIKCPPCRAIQEYPPLHYWQQMQIQLSCTGLQYCDYFDAHFIEYLSEEDWEVDAVQWHQDNPDAKHHIFGIILSYVLDVGEDDIVLNVQENDNDKKGNDEEDDQDDSENEINVKEPSNEKRIKYVYAPPNIRKVDEFNQWAENLEKLCSEQQKETSRTYYKLHKYYISRATADPNWFERNLPSMADIWEKVKAGRTIEGKLVLEQMIEEREQKVSDKKARLKSKNNQSTIFVDLDVSKIVRPATNGRKSNYIHEVCLL